MVKHLQQNKTRNMTKTILYILGGSKKAYVLNVAVANFGDDLFKLNTNTIYS